ncbi:MAG: arsenic metallochaperone ArsD family protein [Betaproteobacteria bacterium]
MRSIQIYDPALCCSTGVCGVDIDTQPAAEPKPASACCAGGRCR